MHTRRPKPLCPAHSSAAVLACSALLVACASTERRTPPPELTRQLFPICVGEQFGYIDQEGALVVPPRLAFAEPFENGFARAWVIPRAPETAFERANPQLLARGGFIDASGRFVVEPVYEKLAPFSEGLAAVRRDGKHGYVDARGEVKIPLQYDAADRFSEGLARVSDADGERFIDHAGKTVLDLGPLRATLDGREVSFRAGGSFSEGLALIVVPGTPHSHWGFVDRSGAVVIAPRFSYAYGMRGGVAHVSVPGPGGSRDAIIDRTGAYAIPPVHGALSGAWDGRAQYTASVDGKSKRGFLDLRNEVVIPARYDFACLWFSEGLCAVKTDERWAYLDAAGNEVITLPPEANYADEFHSGLAKVRTAAGWHFIRRDGMRAFDGVFADAGRFEHGLAVVVLEGGIGGYVNERGELVYRAPEPCTFRLF